MGKQVTTQQVPRLARKKSAPAFSPKTSENRLENRESNSSCQQKTENALELARAVCTLANCGLDPKDYGQKKWTERFRAALKLARTAQDAPPDAILIAAFESGADGNAALDLEYLGHSLALAVLRECIRLANQLERFITGWEKGERFLIVREEQLIVGENRKQVELKRFSALGRYDGVLVDALRNSGVDAGRFARCAVCQAFFYKPRQRSRACSGQCENALKGREHYARMKRAQELKNQDKSLFEIARELGVKAGQVRKYLSAKEK